MNFFFAFGIMFNRWFFLWGFWLLSLQAPAAAVFPLVDPLMDYFLEAFLEVFLQATLNP